MKVVLFCGGQGMRMREASERRAQADDPGRQPADPLARHEVLRPLRVHRLRAVPGLQGRGHQALLPHLQRGAGERLRASARAARRSTCSRPTSTTGTSRSSTPACTRAIGERLRAVRHLLRDDEMFLANYGDTVTDADLPRDDRRGQGRPAPRRASSRCEPNYSFHVVSMNDDGRVDGIRDVTKSDMWINGGYFVLRSEVLDDLQPGRGARRGAVPAADRRRPAARPAPRRLLGADGHAQGQAVAREPARERHAPWELWNADQRARPRVVWLASA